MYIQVLRSAVVCFVAGALLAPCGLSQEVKSSPQSVGLNPERLKEIRHVVQSSVDRGESRVQSRL